jgi:hypothetical protein
MDTLVLVYHLYNWYFMCWLRRARIISYKLTSDSREPLRAPCSSSLIYLLFTSFSKRTPESHLKIRHDLLRNSSFVASFFISLYSGYLLHNQDVPDSDHGLWPCILIYIDIPFFFFAFHPSVTGCGLVDQGSILDSSRYFSSPPWPDRLWGQSGVISLGIDRTEREADFSSPSRAECKNAGTLPPLLHTPLFHGACVWGQLYLQGGFLPLTLSNTE